MPSEKNSLMLPVAFFLDTNILDALPETLESGELNGLVSEANGVKSRVYLPDVVAREWIKHRLDKVLKRYTDIRVGFDHLKKYLDAIPDFKIETDTIVDAVFKDGTRRIRNAGLRILRPPRINTRSMTSNAVFQVAPFAHSNRGFKDELIILSMLGLVRRWTYKSCVLVTKDTHLAEKDIKPRFKRLSGAFRVANNLPDATQLIVETLNQAGQRYYAQVLTSALEHAKSHWKEVSSSIIEKVNAEGVSEFGLTFGQQYSGLEGTLKRVISVNPLEVKGVRPGIPDEGKGGQTQMTIIVDVELELEYEAMEFDSQDLFGRRVKTVEEKREYKPPRYRRVVTTKIVGASVEAKAKLVSDKWEGFEISEVRI